jgi:AhpD family alkylhydroperoxidase
MSARLDPQSAAPEAVKAVLALETYCRRSGLEHSLIELVKTRASQINGCAFCIHMHVNDAIRAGESPDRLFLLDAWRETSLYSDRERAALAWTEALTRLADTRAPDADYDAVRAEFDEAELVNLTVLIGTINVWNRLSVGFRSEPPVERRAAA